MGAEQNARNSIRKHVFVISPNNSGSTLVARALSMCAQAWSLPREGQHMLGFTGPDTIRDNIALTWAATTTSVNLIQNRDLYNWRKTKNAWYFQASATHRDACVFIEKSPPFLLIIDQLLENFQNANFIFLVRNPYPVVEGICRRINNSTCSRKDALLTAANHITQCLRTQKSNIETFGHSGISISYENLCAHPKQTEKLIKNFVPELTDINLKQRIAVKGMYNEIPRNMNFDQLKRLSSSEIKIINTVFEPESELLNYFHYNLVTDCQ